MLKPPETTLAPWQPDHWITQTGYALSAENVVEGTKDAPIKRVQMLVAVAAGDKIIKRIMAE